MNRFLIALACAAGIAACSMNQASTGTRPPIRDGVYKFSERPPQTSQIIEGTFTVVADTILVDAQSATCRYDERSASRSAPITYQCNDFTLSFDRYDPFRRSSYRTTRTVYDKKQVCDQYATNAQGQQVCVRYRTETTERQVPVTGVLHPQRVADPMG